MSLFSEHPRFRHHQYSRSQSSCPNIAAPMSNSRTRMTRSQIGRRRICTQTFFLVQIPRSGTTRFLVLDGMFECLIFSLILFKLFLFSSVISSTPQFPGPNQRNYEGWYLLFVGLLIRSTLLSYTVDEAKHLIGQCNCPCIELIRTLNSDEICHFFLIIDVGCFKHVVFHCDTWSLAAPCSSVRTVLRRDTKVCQVFRNPKVRSR